METKTITIKGVGYGDSPYVKALKDAKRNALIEIFYSPNGTDYFLDPESDQMFVRHEFTKSDKVSGGQTTYPNVEALLKESDVVKLSYNQQDSETSNDGYVEYNEEVEKALNAAQAFMSQIQKTVKAADGTDQILAGVQINVVLAVDYDKITLWLAERGYLACTNGFEYPCKDLGGNLPLSPNLQTLVHPATLETIAKSDHKSFLPNPPQFILNSLPQHSSKVVTTIAPGTYLSNIDVFTNGPPPFGIWMRVRVLHGPQKGAKGWINLPVLRMVTVTEAEAFLENKAALGVLEPEVSPTGITRLIENPVPLTDINPRDIHDDATHLIRIPDDVEALPWLEKAGAGYHALIPWNGSGDPLGSDGKIIGDMMSPPIIKQDTPIIVIDQNTGVDGRWHAIKLVESPKTNRSAIGIDPRMSEQDTYFVLAAYTRPLAGRYMTIPVTPPLDDTKALSSLNVRAMNDQAQYAFTTNFAKARHSPLRQGIILPKDILTRSKDMIDQAKASCNGACFLGTSVYSNTDSFDPKNPKIIFDRAYLQGTHLANVFTVVIMNTEEQLKKLGVERADPKTLAAGKNSPIGDTKEEKLLLMKQAANEGAYQILEYMDKEYDISTLLRTLETTNFARTIFSGPYGEKEAAFLVAIPYRFLRAIPFKTHSFVFDEESREDEQISELVEKAGGLDNVISIFTDPAKIMQALTFLQSLGKKKLPDGILQRTQMWFKKWLFRQEYSEDLFKNPEVNNHKVVYSSSWDNFGLSDLEARAPRGSLQAKIKKLGKVLNHYQRKMDRSRKKWIFPGYSGPLKLVHRRRDRNARSEWSYVQQLYYSITELADMEAGFKPWLSEISLPSRSNIVFDGGRGARQYASPIEIGWTQDWKILYVLVGGHQITTGKCLQNVIPPTRGSDPTPTEEEFVAMGGTTGFALRMPRSAALLHQIDDILAEFKKKKKMPVDKWIQRFIYPAAVVVPSTVSRKGKMKKKKDEMKRLDKAKVKTPAQVKKSQKLSADEELANQVVKEESKKKVNNKDAGLPWYSPSPKTIAALKKTSEIYDYIMNKIGFKVLAEEMLVCLTKDLANTDVSKIVAQLIVGPMYEKMADRGKDENSADPSRDWTDDLQLFFDILDALPKDCTMKVLKDTLYIEKTTKKTEEEQTQLQKPTGYIDLNAQDWRSDASPANPTGSAIAADYVVYDTADQVVPYLYLTETADTPLVQKIDPGEGKTYAPLWQSPSLVSDITAKLAAGTTLKVLKIVGGYFHVLVNSTKKKGYVQTKYVVKEVTNSIAQLRDGTQVNRVLGADKKPLEEKGFWKVEVVKAYEYDAEPGSPAKGKKGWLPSAYLKPLTDKAKEQVKDSTVFLKPGSRDKKSPGVWNEVYAWQLFLCTDGSKGGGADLAKVPKKYRNTSKRIRRGLGKGEWPGRKFGKDTIKYTKKYFESLSKGVVKSKDYVTHSDFKPARKFFNDYNTKKFNTELADMENASGLTHSTPLVYMGNVVFAPAGFWDRDQSGQGAGGNRSKCDWYYVAVVRAIQDVVNFRSDAMVRRKKSKRRRYKHKWVKVRSKRGLKRTRKRVEKNLKRVLIKYNACIGKDTKRVYGANRTWLAGSPTADQIVQEDSYLISSASGLCNDHFEKLVEQIKAFWIEHNGGDIEALEPAQKAGTLWPGKAQITLFYSLAGEPEKKEKIFDAFNKWITCIQEQAAKTEAKIQKIKKTHSEAEEKKAVAKMKAEADALAKANEESEKGGSSEIKTYSPFPTTWEEVLDTFLEQRDWPENIKAQPNGGTKFVHAMQGATCQKDFEKLIDHILKWAEAEDPETAALIQNIIKLGLQISKNMLAKPGFTPFTVPDFPKLSVDKSWKGLSETVGRQWEGVVEQVLREQVMSLVEELRNNVNCQDKKKEDDKNKPDPLNLIDEDSLSDLNDLAKEYGLDLSKIAQAIPPTPTKPGSNFLFLLKEILDGMTPGQKCMVLEGNITTSLMLVIRNKIKEKYPALYDFFSDPERVEALFADAAQFIDPAVCAEDQSTAAPTNIPKNPAILYGECLPTQIGQDNYENLIETGLSPEDAIERARENFESQVARAADILDIVENGLPDITKDPQNDPCVFLKREMSLDPNVARTLESALNTAFNGVLTNFNKEVLSYPAQLSNPRLLKVIQKPDFFNADGTVNEDAASSFELDEDGNIKAATLDKMTADLGGADNDDDDNTSKVSDGLKTKTLYALRIGTDPETGDPIPLRDGKDNVIAKHSPKALAEYIPTVKNFIPDYHEDKNLHMIKETLEGDAYAFKVPLKELRGKDMGSSIAPGIKKALKSRDTVVLSDPTRSRYSFTGPFSKQPLVTYSPTPKTDTLADTYSLVVRPLIKLPTGQFKRSKPYEIRGVKVMPKEVENYLETVEYQQGWSAAGAGPPSVDRTNQSEYFAWYIKKKFEADFAVAFGGVDEIAVEDASNIAASAASTALYDQIQETMLENVLRESSRSRFFNYRDLQSINFAPSLKALAANCKARNNLGDISRSLLNLEDIKKLARETFFDLADPCDVDRAPSQLGPSSEALVISLLTLYLRVHLIEQALYGIFPFSRLNLKDVYDDNVMMSFMYNGLKQNLLRMKVYGKFKKVAKKVVDRRKETEADIAAESEVECLKFLMREQINPVFEQFEIVFKNDNPSSLTWTFFSTMVHPKILESQGRVIDAPIGGYIPKVSEHNRFYYYHTDPAREDFDPSYGPVMSWGDLIKDDRDTLFPHIGSDSGLSRRHFLPEGGFYLERFVKVIDLYGDDGYSIFDKKLIAAVLNLSEPFNVTPTIIDNFLKSDFNKSYGEGNEYGIGYGDGTRYRLNSDGRLVRQDFLKGYVNLYDWEKFMKQIAGRGPEGAVADMYGVYPPGYGFNYTNNSKLKDLMRDDIRALFEELKFGMRLCYLLPEEGQFYDPHHFEGAKYSPELTKYTDALDKLLTDGTTWEGYDASHKTPTGGVRTWRIKERISYAPDLKYRADAKDVVGGADNVSLTTSIATVYSIPMVEVSIEFPEKGEGKPSLSTYGFEMIKGYDMVTNKLRNELAKTAEFKTITEWVFPAKRYAAVASVYSIMATKNMLAGHSIFDITKYMIKGSFEMHLNANNADYQDPLIAQEGGAAEAAMLDQPNSAGLGEAFAVGLLKIAAQAPILILKGIAEIADPNVAMTKKIWDASDFGTKTVKKIAKDQLMNSFDNYKQKTAQELGVPAASDLLPSFKDWAKEENIEIPDPNVGIPPTMAVAVGLSLMPSMLPYGIGFPPPPFGPGVGPPMTPFAIPYYAMGLISDDPFGGPKPVLDIEECEPDSPSNVDNLLEGAPEEDDDDESDTYDVDEGPDESPADEGLDENEGSTGSGDSY